MKSKKSKTVSRKREKHYLVKEYEYTERMISIPVFGVGLFVMALTTTNFTPIAFGLAGVSIVITSIMYIFQQDFGRFRAGTKVAQLPVSPNELEAP